MPKFQAHQFIQNGKTLYAFVAQAGFMYENFDVSRRIEDKVAGYQRSFSSRRIKDLAVYVDKAKGVIPSSIVVNIDEGKSAYSAGDHLLDITGKPPFGFIIDGQHRVKGASEADPTFLLPIIAMEGLTVKEQAHLFVTINKTQKGVPVSLYLDLLNLTEGIIDDYDDPEIPVERRATEIAKRLNEEDDSPLQDLIRMTGDPGRGIALNEFVNRSKYLLDPKKGKLLDFGFEQQYLIFKVYFRAWKSAFLEQWNSADSQMLRQTAFSALLLSLYEIFQLTIQHRGKFTTENLINLLSPLTDFRFDSDTIISGGIKAQEHVSTQILQKLRSSLRSPDTTLIGE